MDIEEACMFDDSYWYCDGDVDILIDYDAIPDEA